MQLYHFRHSIHLIFRAFLLGQKEGHSKGRFLDRISILLLGSSGIGKSSTINNLFNLDEDAENAAKTSSTTSETRSVTEYELQLDLPDNGIKDMKIAIVDSPGFNDTDGVKQDACNFYAIKKFYETHPSGAGRSVYPNLIFVAIPASDSRIEGDSSLLSKSLRALAKLDLVDPNVPNVIGVITKAGQFSRDKKKWIEEFNLRKDAFKKILFKHFQVATEIVALENFPKQEGFSKKGDYYYLPDKVTLQPQNLFRACSDILKKSGDLLGHIVFLDGFKNKKLTPQIGFSVVANTAKDSILSKEEKEVTQMMMLTAEGKSIDETLSDHAMTFIIQKSLGGTEDEDNIKSICLELLKYDISKPEHVLRMTKNDICIMMGKELSSMSLEFLELLGVRNGDPSSLDDTMLLIGRGYNILTDKPVPLSILKFSSRNTKLGIQIPTPAKIVKTNQTRFFMMKFLNKDAFFWKRKNSLNVSLNIDTTLLKTEGRAGFSVKDETSQTSSSEEHSFLVEQRLFQVSIPALEGIPFSDDFSESVTDLPINFNLKLADHRSSYENFFNKFGHFVVLEAFAGGSIVVKTSMDTSSGRSFDEIKKELAASFNRGIMGVFNTGISGAVDNTSTTESKGESILDQSSVEFNGGDTELHTKATITDPKLMSQWKMSLGSNLAMLDTDLSLIPISEMVKKIDKKKGSECYKALEHFLGGQFKVVETKEQQRLEMLKGENEKLERQRKENCITRDQDVKAEKRSSWRNLSNYGWLWGYE